MRQAALPFPEPQGHATTLAVLNRYILTAAASANDKSFFTVECLGFDDVL